MQFVKMHGIGNDFILIDAMRAEVENPAALSKRLCRRRFGIGADGLILICPSRVADVKMRVFNSDGSEPEMCGNGIRCAGKFVYDQGIRRGGSLSVETLAGVKRLALQIEGDAVSSVTVDMGEPEFDPRRIPVDAPENRVRVPLDGREVTFFCVSMGNPHAVTFDLYPDEADFLRLGAA